jgi:hypothetical protein
MISLAEQQLFELENRVIQIAADVGQCVSVLASPGELPRFAIAERLLPLGTALIPHLSNLLRGASTDGDLRGCAALLGFTVGDREDCAMALLDEIDSDGPWALLAARRLADAGYPGAVSVIESALRRVDSSSVDAIVGLLQALRSADGHLSAELRRSLASGGHWQVDTALRELFPEPTRS